MPAVFPGVPDDERIVAFRKAGRRAYDDGSLVSWPLAVVVVAQHQNWVAQSSVPYACDAQDDVDDSEEVEGEGVHKTIRGIRNGEDEEEVLRTDLLHHAAPSGKEPGLA